METCSMEEGYRSEIWECMGLLVHEKCDKCLW